MIDANVELRRLAELMHVEVAELEYLNAVGAEGIKLLRTKFQDSLVDDFEPALSKLAATAGMVPVAISEKICVKYLGPTLTSYLSYYTPVKTATKLAQRFEASFMIEVASEQIPERAKALLADFPVDLMRPVTAGLVAKSEWATLGGFVDYLPEEKSLALMAEVPDPVANLRIASFAQNKELIARMVTKFDDDTLAGLVTAAAKGDDVLKREVCIVAENLPESSMAQLIRVSGRIAESEQMALEAYARNNGFKKLVDIYQQIAF